MMKLGLVLEDSSPLTVLCLGAHSDDIEIGCGGTVLRLAEQYPACKFHWVVFTAAGRRETEARKAAGMFAGPQLKPVLKQLKDGFMPYIGADVKTVFENELKQLSPDLIFTHYGKDAHQDHRLVSELTWNTFRNHLILEYEIPKYDGDMGQPNFFVPLTRGICEKKVGYLTEIFQTQGDKHWFQPETFLGLMRLRGMECNAPSGYAEAFYCRKAVL
jgi:LmbE family N-acetylglucosaminyl deacetylase